MLFRSVFLSFFSVFIFSMPSKEILIVYITILIVLGHKYVLGPSQTQTKSGPKHIYAREHKLYCYIIPCSRDMVSNRVIFAAFLFLV